MASPKEIRQNLEQVQMLACIDKMVMDQNLVIATSQATIANLKELRKFVEADKANAAILAHAAIRTTQTPG